MSTWTRDELTKIEAADELDLASVRTDGKLRNPVTMWVVRHGNDLYVRSVNGRESSWFRGAQARHEAHIHAGGVDKDVLLVETDDVDDELCIRWPVGGCAQEGSSPILLRELNHARQQPDVTCDAKIGIEIPAIAGIFPQRDREGVPQF